MMLEREIKKETKTEWENNQMREWMKNTNEWNKRLDVELRNYKEKINDMREERKNRVEENDRKKKEMK